MSTTTREFCIVSTMHVSKETNAWLRAQAIVTAQRCTMRDPEPSEYVMAGPYGYWLFVGDDPPGDDLPGDLQAVFNYCREQGAEWLDLDCDGDTVDDLPKFDW
jgi:hypothetical protein